MPHLILQLASLIAALFVIGCLLGSLARKRKADNHYEVPDSAQQVKAAKGALEKQEQSVQTTASVVHTLKAEAEKVEVPDTIESTEKVEVEEVIARDLNAEKTKRASTSLADRTEESDPVTDIQVTDPIVVEKPEPIVEIGLPQLLKEPRGAKPDDLLKIKGIGPTLQRKLHALGIYHYDQLAAWDADNAIWVGKRLNFPGRVEREEWVEQAAALMKPSEKTPVKPPKKAQSKKTTASKPRKKAPTTKAAAKSTKRNAKPITSKTN